MYANIIIYLDDECTIMANVTDIISVKNDVVDQNNLLYEEAVQQEQLLEEMEQNLDEEKDSSNMDDSIGNFYYFKKTMIQ